MNQVKILKTELGFGNCSGGTESLPATNGLYIATEYCIERRCGYKMSVRTAFGQLNRPCTVFSTCFDYEKLTRAKKNAFIKVSKDVTPQSRRILRAFV